MKIVIVDDHSIFRQGLRSLLESEDLSVEVVGEAANGVEALSLCEKVSPDLVIMDISMPSMGGLQATAMIKERMPAIKVIILSKYTESTYVKEALGIGVSAYIHKDAVFDELKLAIASMNKELVYLSPLILKPLIDCYLKSSLDENSAFSVFKKLSSREKEVFYYLSNSTKRRDIAKVMSVSPKTVDSHKQNILDKLKLKNELEMKEFAEKIGRVE